MTSRKRTAALVFCLCTVLLVACGMQAKSLENTQWSLVSFGPAGAETLLVEASRITLSIEDGNSGGFGGCNTYGGKSHVQGNEMTFSEITSTLVACADERVTQQEQQYFQTLNGVRRFELKGARLYLYDENGQLMLTFDGSPSLTPTTNP